MLLFGALLGMTFGWPLVGAIVGSTWLGTLHDSVGPDEAAALRILHRQPHLFDRERPKLEEMLGSPCQNMLAHRSSFKNIDDVDLASTLRWSARWRDDAEARFIAQEMLRNLPRPALGALDYCLGGSILSRTCQLYTQRKIIAALGRAEPQLSKKREENKASAERMACRALAKSP